MSESEVMTILLLFHLSAAFKNLKAFYVFYIQKHMGKEFPRTVSYNRFVELQPLKSMDLLPRTHLRKAIREQGLHRKGSLRTAFRGRRTFGHKDQKEHEERLDAPSRQNHAQEEGPLLSRSMTS